MIQGQNIYRELLQSWAVAYEKAIREYAGRATPKRIVDEAYCYAVEDWTKRLLELGLITAIMEPQYDSMLAAIEHHIENLIAASMWTEQNRPTITLREGRIDELDITIPHCGYSQGCKDKAGINQQDFNKPENLRQFPCQRLGCFVGAVRKYLAPNTLPDQERTTYQMTTVHTEQGCTGVIFVQHRG
ncbi:hypothetical protein [Oxynema aestuarii]|uniref:Uncharacterized protein n=1 Tax=Oxynema aestuarii AP17 TaxID=2064643 RepID=A0A6H1TTS1_9CYAN|nr:hypothetical protein [Oxynema aestuarii]QIZ69616.1 hypothetical protein HCG48_02640 [Oxynema aestuarii AP17]